MLVLSNVCYTCDGQGWYSYDEIHGTPCEACCKHDKGWWVLKEHYGENNDKLCCLAGCGAVKDIEEYIVEMFNA